MIKKRPEDNELYSFLLLRFHIWGCEFKGNFRKIWEVPTWIWRIKPRKNRIQIKYGVVLRTIWEEELHVWFQDNLRVVSCCNTACCTMSTVEPIFKINFRLSNQIIRAKKIPVVNLNRKNWILGKRCFKLKTSKKEKEYSNKIQYVSHRHIVGFVRQMM